MCNEGSRLRAPGYIMDDNNIILEKSKMFALRIARLYKFLKEEKNEFILSKQLLKSGTSIGANVNEAVCGQSRADFCGKMYIAYKEAQETKYWLELLFESEFLDQSGFDSIYSDCMEIIRILSAITKTAKGT